MANPLLSVCVITYNHGPFIRQSLDSVAMQQVNFDMELIIADDKSKDDTTAIIEDFIKTYPGKVIFLKREKNLGPADNFIDMINTATGKYVAYMEGDDYWTHPKKLQMQVDFLEKNESVTLSSHNSTILLRSGETYPYNRDERYAKGPHEAVYKVEDYLVKDFFHSSAIMYRRSALPGFPSWYREAFGGDYFLVLFVTMRGDIHYINEPLSVYRIHGKSVSNFSSRYEIFRNFKRHFKKFDEYSDYKFHKLLSRKSFAFEFGFYYYHPQYLKKWWFAITNLHKIVQISPSVISRWARYKIFVPTPLLRSKVDLFSKVQA